MKDNDSLTSYLQGMMAEDIKGLTKEEEYALSKRIHKGDEKALHKLIRHNLRLVVYMLRKTTAWQHSTIPPEDLIQMGNEALIMSAKKWTPTKNARFASYAGNYILRYVTRQLDNTERMIRLPINIVEAVKKMNYLERQLRQVLGREPKVQELATEMGVSARKISQLKGYVMREPISLDAFLNDKNEELNDD
jgi:RNA polymerase primary sigma factor